MKVYWCEKILLFRKWSLQVDRQQTTDFNPIIISTWDAAFHLILYHWFRLGLVRTLAMGSAWTRGWIETSSWKEGNQFGRKSTRSTDLAKTQIWNCNFSSRQSPSIVSSTFTKCEQMSKLANINFYSSKNCQFSQKSITWNPLLYKKQCGQYSIFCPLSERASYIEMKYFQNIYKILF